MVCQIFECIRNVANTYWTNDNVFNFVLVFTWITFSWEMYLAFRQYKVYKKNQNLPSELAGILDHETFEKARLYSLDKTRYGFYSNTWSQILNTIVLLYGILPYLWYKSGELNGYFNQTDEILQTLTFALVGSIISTIIDLPWTIYYTFVIEEKHGFNKQTAGFFVKDKIKKFFVSQAISLPILSLLIAIIKLGGEYFFIYLWVFSSLLIFFMITIYADFIAPLFDKYVELPEGELREKIEALASSISFPLKKLYIVEGSKRSSHSNAYLYGFFKNKRIVLYDTLLQDYTPSHEKEEKEKQKEQEKEENLENKSEQSDVEKEKKENPKGCNNDEILAVLAHELGHWKLSHVVKNLVLSEVNMFFSFLIFGLLYQNDVVYQSFGFYDKPVFIGLLIIFQFIFSPYNELLQFLMTCLTRRFEFQADAYAKHLNRASFLRDALIKLNNDNLGFPIYDKLYSSWHHSHPPLLERIEALGKLD